jgi:hypothetical protein
LIFTFNRSLAANADPNTSITVEYGSTLGGWTTATAGVDIVITETPGLSADSVEVKLRRSLGLDGKLFARLSVAVTP